MASFLCQSVQSVSLLFLLISGSLADFASEPYIFGGENATDTSQFPYLASLRKDNGTFHSCGASILSDRFLVTAGHCYSIYTEVSDYRVVVGALRKEDKGEQYTVKRFIRHPGYTIIPFDKPANDIALIEVKRKIQFNSKVSPIAISRDFIGKNVSAVTAGWGSSEVCLILKIFRAFYKNKCSL